MRVLVVEPHTIVRAGLRAIIESAGDLEWAGEGDEPDAAIVSSPAAAATTAARHPTAGLLLLTAGGETAALAAIHSGARSAISHRASPADIVRAIRAVGDGQALISADLAGALFGAH